MSDEIKTTETKECNCFCRSEGFRKFLIVALGTFVGVYFALSLFTALHRPPVMPPPYPMQYGFHGPMNVCPVKGFQHHHFDKMNKHLKGDFQKPNPGDFAKRTPFEEAR